jgi:non-ribosomal peptide synthetase component F
LSKLSSVPVLDLNLDRPRPTEATYVGSRHWFRLSPSLSAQIDAFNRRMNVTAFMTLLAGFQVLLARSSGQEDIVVGTPIANRQRRELEDLIGFFANTLALRTDLSGDPSFSEVAARVRQTVLDAHEHQDVPFEKLVEELNPARDLSRHPIFQVVFSLQNAPGHPLALTGLEVTSIPSPTVSTRFDIEMSLWAEGDAWAGWLSYNSDLFDAATIERMLGHYQVLLAAMVEEPERPIWQVPMLSAAERNQIVVGAFSSCSKIRPLVRLPPRRSFSGITS